MARRSVFGGGRVVQREEDTNFAFSAKLDCVGTAATLLKALQFHDKVNLFIMENGLKFVVEEGKYVQAYILMQKQLFQEYELNDDEIQFKIPLKELLECLKIFSGTENKSGNDTTAMTYNGSSTSLILRCKDFGSPFEFLLEENAMHTEFKLKTEEVDDLMNFDIDPVECKIALKSDLFLDLLTEVDSNGPEFVEISVTPRDSITIRGKGTAGLMVEVIIPAGSKVVEYFDCSNPCKATHKFNILKYAFKAMSIGEKVVMKMNADGILSFSFLHTGKVDSFVEFFCIPLDTSCEEGW